MLTVLITTKDNEDTFQKSFTALNAACRYYEEKTKLPVEIVIVSPFAYPFLQNEKVILVEDPHRGKPEAINIGIKEAKGEWIVLSDGDILLDEKSIYSLYNYTLSEKLSIAGGKPVSLEDKRTMLGYWSQVLVEGNAANIRKIIEGMRKNGKFQFFPVSGYLFIIKKAIIPKLPTNVLSDDAYISYVLYSKGYQIGYDESAIVYVSYPKTYKDYILQKKRSAGGYSTKEMSKSKVRSFGYEAIYGTLNTLKYANNPKEFVWSVLLLLSRIHLWVLIFYTLHVKKDENIWKVVESSKNLA